MDCWAVKDREICSLSNQWAGSEGGGAHVQHQLWVVLPLSSLSRFFWRSALTPWLQINHSSPQQIRKHLKESLPCLISCEHWWILVRGWGRMCMRNCSYVLLVLAPILLLCIAHCVSIDTCRISCYLCFPPPLHHSLDNNLFDLIYSAHPFSPFRQSIKTASPKPLAGKRETDRGTEKDEEQLLEQRL